jgi:NHL repeat
MSPTNWRCFRLYAKRGSVFPLALLAAALCSNLVIAQPAMYSFVTIAGDASAGSINGTNNDARFYFPSGLALDSAGNVFVADTGNNTIRKLAPVETNWISSTIAGLAGHQGSADGTNGNARFNTPLGIAVDGSGNVIVADSAACTIRKLTRLGTNWVVSTIAGLSGTLGTADGTNQDARFWWPTSVAVDGAGDVWVGDDRRLRKLSQVGTNWVTSTISFTRSGFGNVNWVAFDASGALYVAGAYFIGNDGYYGIIARVDQAGTNWVAANLPRPPDGNRGLFQITSGPQGQILLTKQNHTIWQLVPTDTNWIWSRVAGQSGVAGSTDGTNDAALFNFPFGAAMDGNGNLFVADHGNNTIRKLTPEGTNWVSTTIAGQAPKTAAADGTNRAATFSAAWGVAVGPEGSIFVADIAAHAIRETDRIGDDWVTRTIAGLIGTPGSADGTNTDARLKGPQGLAVGGTGLLYVADTGNNTIRKLERLGTNWVASTIAGLAGSTNRQDGTNDDIHFDGPTAIAVDATGTLYVAEEWHRAVRKLTAKGTNWVSTTIADEAGPVILPYPSGLAVGTDGVLCISDQFGGTGQLAPSGTNWLFTRIAAANGVAAAGLAVDGADNLLVTDDRSNTIRRLVRLGTNWVSYVLAGSPGSASFQDGTNSEARFLGPGEIAVDRAGNLYITDGNTLRLGLRIPVEAPAAIIRNVLEASGGLTFTWTAFQGIHYQAQYISDLALGNWTNLGDAISATNDVMSITDAPGPARQRFYRVVLLP